MRFMLVICDQVGETDQPGPEELAADPRFDPWRAEVERRGGFHGGQRLRPAEEATTVRVRGGEVLRSAGPFAAWPEAMGGFDIVECADYEDAVRLASMHPCAETGAVEVRPIW